jgi:hypothetical protein
MGLMSKAVSKVKMVKSTGSVYNFQFTAEKEIAQFIALITAGHKSVKVSGNTVKFTISNDETTAGEFIAFAKAAKVLK